MTKPHAHAITGYHGEKWDLFNRGIDDQGRPMCHVRRIKVDGAVIVWRLIQRESRNGIVGWYNIGQYIGVPGLKPEGCKGYRPSPEKNGKKLSGSRIDLTLLSFAENSHV